jgi:hypothetical protein
MAGVAELRRALEPNGGDSSAPQGPTDISRYVTATNSGFLDPAVAHVWNPFTAGGRAALDAVVTNQAQVIAYIDDYRVLMLATLVMFPLLLVFRSPQRATRSALPGAAQRRAPSDRRPWPCPRDAGALWAPPGGRGV